MNEEEVRSASRNIGISEDEARLRLALASAMEELREELRTRYGDVYGGMWYVAGPPWRIALGVTSDPETVVRDVAERFPRPKLLVGVGVERPLRELDRVQDSVDGRRADLRRRDVDVHAEYVDHARNVVVLEVASRSMNDEEIARDELHYDKVEIRTGIPVQPSACGWLQCSSLRGGMKVATGSSGGGNTCSLGFGAKSKTDAAPYVITAAHCFGGTGSHQSYNLYANKDGVGWQLIGKHHNGQYGGQADAAIVHEETSNWALNRYLIHSSSNTAYSISSVYQGTSLTTVDVLCATGYVSTAPDCQNVTNGDWNGSVAGVSFTNQVEFGQCGAQGDSGGSVYANGGAYGVLHSNNGCFAGSVAIASYARHVQDILNVNICTSTSCP